MTWAEHHQRSEALAEQAFLAMQSGQEVEARALYAKAAEEEEQALNDLDTSKQRTLGITGVSAVSLWYKSNELEKAEQLANALLHSKALPEFARFDLQAALPKIHAISSKKPARNRIEKPLAIKRLAPIVTMLANKAHIVFPVIYNHSFSEIVAVMSKLLPQALFAFVLVHVSSLIEKTKKALRHAHL